jgi:hypothetical protein
LAWNDYQNALDVMRKRLSVIFAYLALLTLSLGVPLLHYYQTDQAIEAMRPAMKMEDGNYSPMLMPDHILLLRWLGELSSFVPVSVFVAFALSFRREEFARPATLLWIAIFQSTFTTIYALYSILLLGSEWLQR